MSYGQDKGKTTWVMGKIKGRQHELLGRKRNDPQLLSPTTATHTTLPPKHIIDGIINLYAYIVETERMRPFGAKLEI